MNFLRQHHKLIIGILVVGVLVWWWRRRHARVAVAIVAPVGVPAYQPGPDSMPIASQLGGPSVAGYGVGQRFASGGVSAPGRPIGLGLSTGFKA
jgi:hypothetical protein